MILVQLSGGGHLATNAAASYERMSRAYGRPLPVTSATRTRAEQAVLYAGYVKRLPGYAFALPPGESVHETGYACDYGRSAWAWLAANARRFGWVRTNPAEAWHYEYRYALDQSLPGRVPAPVAVPVRLASKDDDMTPFVQMLFLAYLGRDADPQEVLDWVRASVAAAPTTTELEAMFRQSVAEGGTVVRAFRRYLGLSPSPEQVDTWADGTNTIAQVFAGVAGSPAALARR